MFIERVVRRDFALAAYALCCFTVLGAAPQTVQDPQLRERTDDAVRTTLEGVRTLAITAGYDVPGAEDLRWELPSGGEVEVHLYIFADTKSASRKLEELWRGVSTSPTSAPDIGDGAHGWGDGNTRSLCFRVRNVTVALNGWRMTGGGREICERIALIIAEKIEQVLDERRIDSTLEK